MATPRPHHWNEDTWNSSSCDGCCVRQSQTLCPGTRYVSWVQVLTFLFVCVPTDRQKTTRPSNAEIPTVLNTGSPVVLLLIPFLTSLTPCLSQWGRSASAGGFSCSWPTGWFQTFFGIFMVHLAYGWFLPHIQGSFVKVSVVCERALKLRFSSSGWCGSVDWALACEPKACWVDSQSGHALGCRPGPQ